MRYAPLRLAPLTSIAEGIGRPVRQRTTTYAVPEVRSLP